jgi:hypothetical protein
MSLSSIALLAGLASAAVASSAAAEEVRIPIAGLTPHQAHVAILRAADQVCASAALEALGPYSTQTCVADAVAKADGQLREIRSARALQTVKPPIR